MRSDAGPMEWLGDVESHGVRERRFDVIRGDRVVPGLLWSPVEAGTSRPLVLLGHGASGSKREEYIVALARRLVRHLGYAAVAIDGPVHGDRRPRRSDHDAPGLDAPLLDFAQMWSEDPTMTDAVVADWRATLDALAGQADIGAGPVGYWGLSMGTILGLPLVVAEPRVQVAVLGLAGLIGPTSSRLADDAAALRRPVLFLLQWHDEIFPRDRVLSLFDALGTPDKRLHAQPGRHAEVPPEEFAASEAFLDQHLGA